MLIFMKHQDSTPFGRRLQKARKDAGLTQIEAAKKIGMSQGTLGELERDGKGSSYTAALATLYGVDALWLATGKGESPRLANVKQATRNSDKEPAPPNAKQFGELNWLFMKMLPEYREVLLIAARKVAQESEDERQQGAG